MLCCFADFIFIAHAQKRQPERFYQREKCKRDNVSLKSGRAYIVLATSTYLPYLGINRAFIAIQVENTVATKPSYVTMLPTNSQCDNNHQRTLF